MTARTIERTEAIEILHKFIPLAVNGELDPAVIDIIESTVGDVAEGHEVIIQQGPLLEFTQTFFACFDFDDEEGTYLFQRDNLIATGETGPGTIKI